MIPFLLRFWQPIAGLLCAGLIWWAVAAYGHHRYESGRAAERAIWLQAKATADKALAAANARTAAVESSSKAALAAQEARHASEVADVTARADAADRRIRAISVRIAARSASCQSMPAVPGSSPRGPDPAEIERRAAEAGGSIAAVGRDCALDAHELQEWIDWYHEQARIHSE